MRILATGIATPFVSPQIDDDLSLCLLPHQPRAGDSEPSESGVGGEAPDLVEAPEHLDDADLGAVLSLRLQEGVRVDRREPHLERLSLVDEGGDDLDGSDRRLEVERDLLAELQVPPCAEAAPALPQRG